MKLKPGIQLQFMKFSFFVVTLICTIPHTCAQKFEPNFNIPGQNVVYDMTSNSKFVFASTGGSGLFRSADEGTNWEDITNGTGGGYFFSLLSAHDSLYTGSFGSVFFSSDNGSSWSDLNLGLALNDDVLALGKNHFFLFAGIRQKGIYKRSLTGGAWSASTTGLHSNATVNDLLFVGSLVYAATDKGLYASGNGSSWSQMTGGLPTNIIINKLYLKDTILIAGTNNGFYKSSTYGLSWTYAGNGGAPVTPNIVSLTSLGNIWFGGAVSNSLHGVFLSFDRGSSWTTYTANAAAAMPYYSLASTQNFVFAGIGNSILRYTPPPVGINEVSFIERSFSIYPNPCSDRVSVIFPAGMSSLEIYDSHGKQVLSAQQSENVDVSALAPGLYYAVINHQVGISSRKFIKE